VRREDWPERLAAVLEAARSRTYTERDHCAEFANDVVLALTGTEPLPERLRGLSRSACYRAVREAGYRDAAAAAEGLVGERVAVALAQRGDLVLRVDDDGEAFGVCCGKESAFVADGVDLAFYPTLECAAAFRVG